MAETDLALIRAWAKGDRAAGGELFDRHYDAIDRFFRNKVEDRSRDDLVQQVFYRCTRTAERFRGDATFRTYVFRVAHTVLIDHFRSRARHEGRTQWEPDGDDLDIFEQPSDALTASPERAATKREERRILLKALRAIELKYQIVLELHYWEDLTGEEIAEIVAAPLGTVKTRLRTGRVRLREAVEEVESSPAAIKSTLDDLEAWARRTRALEPEGA